MNKGLNKTRILIVAYYRGGSSLLGKLLAENPHVFYYYEPFFQPLVQYRAKTKLQGYGDVYIDEHGKFRFVYNPSMMVFVLRSLCPQI